MGNHGIRIAPAFVFPQEGEDEIRISRAFLPAEAIIIKVWSNVAETPRRKLPKAHL